MNAVTLINISKSFKTTNALNDISLHVNKGELFGILGPDGAGKSSLFRVIATLLIPDQGKAVVNGFDTVREYMKIRDIIGYMPGRFSLYHDLSVEENINFYATVFGTSFKKNYDLIRDIFLHLEPFKKRFAGHLSGGMKQKLALCCALIHRPEILLLDEPTTGVDAVSRKEFWEMLYNIKKEGISILVSTPYMDEAEKCDRVSLIQNGRIMITGKPSEIPGKMDKPLYSVKPGENILQSLACLRAFSWCHSAWLFGREIHLAIKKDSLIAEVFRDMDSEGFKYRPIAAGIEDAFIDMMKESK